MAARAYMSKRLKTPLILRICAVAFPFSILTFTRNNAASRRLQSAGSGILCPLFFERAFAALCLFHHGISGASRLLVLWVLTHSFTRSIT